MDKIYVLFLIVVPVSMFFGGFFTARQFRALQNVSIFSRIFIERKLLLSVGMGLFISLSLAVIFSSAVEFSTKLLLILVGLFLLATASFYIGITLGWGQMISVARDGETVGQIQMDSLPDNVVMDDTSGAVKITINTRKRWAWFVMSLSQWLFIGLFGLPILGLLLISALQDLVPVYFNILIGVCVGGLALYLLYTKFQQALEYVFDKEIIEIDHLSVKIEKSGSGFKSRKEYPAENIKKITVLFSSGGANTPIRRSPYVNSIVPAFILWHNHGPKRYHAFGRAVDLADAQSILEMIYSKFPQYRG
ncbi:MAG: hypothetical protein JW976_01610 [Syntrophaceae bacterium]|nr:hypothetical protein [Syntrophaceae bacterium]